MPASQRKRGRPPKHLTSDEKNTALSTARKAYNQRQAQQKRAAQPPHTPASDTGGCDDTQDEIVVAGGEALELLLSPFRDLSLHDKHGSKRRGRPPKHTTDQERDDAQQAAREAYNERHGRARLNRRAVPPDTARPSASPPTLTTHEGSEGIEDGDGGDFSVDGGGGTDWDEDPFTFQAASEAVSVDSGADLHEDPLLLRTPSGADEDPLVLQTASGVASADSRAASDRDVSLFQAARLAVSEAVSEAAPFDDTGDHTSPSPTLAATAVDDEADEADNAAAAQQAMADILVSWLRGFIGCSLDQHTAAHNEHTAAHRADGAHPHCHSLEDITCTLQNQPTGQCPSAGQHHDAGQTRPTKLPDVLARAKAFALAETELDIHCQLAFEGVTTKGAVFGAPAPSPPQLCLPAYYSQTTDEAAPFATSFDIDSIAGFTETFAFAKTGLKVFLDMHPQYNITTDVHLSVDVPLSVDSDSNRCRAVPLAHVPHFPFARLEGWDNMVLHVVFPRLYRPRPRRRRGQHGTNTNRTSHGNDGEGEGEGSGQPRPPPKHARPLARTLLTAAQYTTWYERIFLPALVLATAVRGPDGALLADPNYVTYLPKSRKMAQDMTYAKSEERRTGVSIDDGADGTAPDEAHAAGPAPLRQQITHYVAAEHLQTLAAHMRAIIADDPNLSLFHGFVIYFSAKNLKAMYIRSVPALDAAAVDAAFHSTTARFDTHWTRLIDEQHLDPARVYVDLAKQHTAFGAGADGSARQPPTFLWRSCCLETACNEYRAWVNRFAGQRDQGRRGGQDGQVQNGQDGQDGQDGQRQDGRDDQHNENAQRRQNQINRGQCSYQRPAGPGYRYPPTVTRYPWALTRDAGGVTITPAKNGPDAHAGVMYTQLYNTVKAPFDAQKKYVLHGANLETLAFDPLYLKSLQQATRATAALGNTALATAEAAYQRGKERAREALEASSTTCFGVRQEHRVTLTLFRILQTRWSSTTPARTAALPWFSLRSKAVFQFLYEQINRHCYGLERGRMRAGKQFSLPDTATMVVMVRMFQYCYCSNLLQKQQLLFGDKWRPTPLRTSAEGGRSATETVRRPLEEQIQVETPVNDLDGAASRDEGGDSEGGVSGEEDVSCPATSDDGSEWQEDGSVLFDSDEEDLATDSNQPGAELVQDDDRLNTNEDGRPDTNEVTGQGGQTVQGLGLYASMERGGFGWWQPGRFDWDYWALDDRIVRLYTNRRLYANGRLYKRQAAITQADNVYRKANLAANLYTQNRLDGPAAKEPRQLWLDLLCFLIIRQFDLDVWQAMLQEHAAFPELTPDAVRQHGPNNPPTFCWSGLSRLFYDRRGPSDNAGPPWFLVGHRAAWQDTHKLVQHLFEWRDDVTRKGWANKPYRVLTQRLYGVVEQRLGARTAAVWLRRLERLITLTHWVLPSPSRTFGFFNRTVDDAGVRPIRRVLWYSSVYRRVPREARRDEYSADAATTRQQYQRGEQQLQGREAVRCQSIWARIRPEGYRFVAFSSEALQVKLAPYNGGPTGTSRPAQSLAVRDFRKQAVWEDLHLVLRHGAYKDDGDQKHWLYGRDGDYPVVEAGTPPVFQLLGVVQQKETEVEAWFRTQVTSSVIT